MQELAPQSGIGHLQVDTANKPSRWASPVSVWFVELNCCLDVTVWFDY